MNIYWRALRFFREDRPRLALAFGLILASALTGLLKPWPLAALVDSILGDKKAAGWGVEWILQGTREAQIARVAGAILMIYLMQATFVAVQNYVTIQIGLRGLTRVRAEVFAVLQRLSWRYHQGQQTGDLLYRATWDTYSIQTLLQQGVVTTFGALISLLLMLGVMFRVNWRLTLIALGVVPLLLFAIRTFGRRMTAQGMAAQKADGAVAAALQQTLTALPLIQSFTREPEQQSRFDAESERSQKERLAQHGWEIMYGWGVALAFALGTAAIAWSGGEEILSGRLSVGGLLVFLAYLGQLYEPLNQLSHAGATVATASASAQRVFEILDTPEQVTESPDARSVVQMNEGERLTTNSDAGTKPLIIRGRITFEGVTFGYRKDVPVLHRVDLDIPAGQCLALIGPSGAGKTSLLHLAPRFYDPDEGIVRLDGVDLKQLHLRDLRLQIALAMQESILLPGTIFQNIAFGKPGAARGEIEAAARAAGAHTFIKNLPREYETVVGEGAARLSVGEKQRIGLARALIKNAPILLLDEPTSALDRPSEDAVLEGLRERIQGKTVVLITHRPEALQLAQRVVLVEPAKVTEFSSAAEAMEVWRKRVIS